MKVFKERRPPLMVKRKEMRLVQQFLVKTTEVEQHNREEKREKKIMLLTSNWF